MSFIMGYIMGSASSSNDCPEQVPKINIEIEKCKALPTKAQTLVCLKDIQQQEHDAAVFGSYCAGGFIIIVAIIIAFVWMKA